MPHPAGTVVPGVSQGWGDAWGDMKWAEASSGGSVGGQVVRRRIGWARGERLISALGSSDPVRVAKL